MHLLKNYQAIICFTDFFKTMICFYPLKNTLDEKYFIKINNI